MIWQYVSKTVRENPLPKTISQEKSYTWKRDLCIHSHKKALSWEFPGDLVVRIQHLHCCSPGSIPGLGIESPYQAAACLSQRNKCQKTTSSPQEPKHPKYLTVESDSKFAYIYLILQLDVINRRKCVSNNEWKKQFTKLLRNRKPIQIKKDEELQQECGNHWGVGVVLVTLSFSYLFSISQI